MPPSVSQDLCSSDVLPVLVPIWRTLGSCPALALEISSLRLSTHVSCRPGPSDLLRLFSALGVITRCLAVAATSFTPQMSWLDPKCVSVDTSIHLREEADCCEHIPCPEPVVRAPAVVCFVPCPLHTDASLLRRTDLWEHLSSPGKCQPLKEEVVL